MSAKKLGNPEQQIIVQQLQSESSLLEVTGHRGLDVFSFTAANARDGIGPHLATFLLSKGRMSASIGWAISAARLTALISTAFAGYILGRVPKKRPVIALASLFIAVAVGVIRITQDSFS